MKILIAYDGSSCSEAALDDLVRAGLPEAGEFAVMSVAEVWLAPENLRLQWEAENPDSDYLNEINRRHDKKSKETIAEFATLANHAAVMWSSLRVFRIFGANGNFFADLCSSAICLQFLFNINNFRLFYD